MPLFRKKSPPETPATPEQAVLVKISPPRGDEEVALDEIEDPLIEAIEAAGVGEFDGHEIGEDGATLYMYGPDAERLFAVIEPALRRAGLPAGSYVTLRFGEPGAAERHVDL